MPYATRADLEARYGEAELVQLSDALGTGVSDEAVLDQALADASAEMEGYLARYAGQPLTLPILNLYACDIARYRLWRDAASEEVRARYRDAIRFLEQVAKGAISLGAAAEAAVGENTVSFTTGQKVFGREAL